MKLSDKLRAERAEKFEKMQGIVTAANGAELSGDAAKEFDTLDSAIKALDERIVRAAKAEEAVRGEAPADRRTVIVDGEGNQRTILTPKDALFARYAERVHPEFREQCTLGAAIRGMVTGKWHGRDLLQRALAEGAGATGGYAVPAVLSAMWLDQMRAQSVMMLAGTGTLQMPNGNLKVAGLASDPVPASKKENTAFPVSEPTFREVAMRARTYGVVVESSVELMNDAKNAESMVEASLLGAMAGTFDRAAISGDGSTAGNLDNVTGLLALAGIPETAAIGTPGDYDPWLDAMAAMDAVNFAAKTVIDNPSTTNLLRKLVTGITSDKTKLVPPADYTALQRLKSNNVTSGASIVGDFSRGTYGVTEAISLEATRQGGAAFANYQVLVRAVMRFDFAPLWKQGFHRLLGITYA